MDKRMRMKVAFYFGVILKELRNEAGFSQEELAGDAEFDRTYPSLLERGLRTPTLTVIFQLADALGIDAAKMVQMTQERMERS
jgi:transcriptional regulator with XRE-family HTH domain